MPLSLGRARTTLMLLLLAIPLAVRAQAPAPKLVSENGRHAMSGRWHVVPVLPLLIRGRLIVICNHSGYLLIGVQFHKLAGLRALLIEVVEYDAGDSPQHVQQLKSKIGKGFEPSRKITAQGFFALDGSGGIAQQLCSCGRCENNPRCVMGHNGFEIVRIPRLNPIIRKFSNLGFCEHRYPLRL